MILLIVVPLTALHIGADAVKFHYARFRTPKHFSCKPNSNHLPGHALCGGNTFWIKPGFSERFFRIFDNHAPGLKRAIFYPEIMIKAGKCEAFLFVKHDKTRIQPSGSPFRLAAKPRRRPVDYIRRGKGDLFTFVQYPALRVNNADFHRYAAANTGGDNAKILKHVQATF